MPGELGREYKIYIQHVTMFFPKIANSGKSLIGGISLHERLNIQVLQGTQNRFLLCQRIAITALSGDPSTTR